MTKKMAWVILAQITLLFIAACLALVFTLHEHDWIDSGILTMHAVMVASCMAIVIRWIKGQA